MDLLERVKDRIDPDRKSALEQWYAFVDQESQQATVKIRQQLAFELGHIPDTLLTGIRAIVATSLRAAGRYVASSKLAEPIRSVDPAPSTPPASGERPEPTQDSSKEPT